MKILNSVNPQVKFLNLVFLQILSSIPTFYCPVNKKITIKVSAIQKNENDSKMVKFKMMEAICAESRGCQII